MQAKNKDLAKTILNIVKSDSEISRYIDEVDPSAFKIFEYLVKKGPISEAKMVADLKYEKSNTLRKVLYKMYERDIIGYKEKKKGRMIEYYWFANIIYLIDRMIKNAREEIFKIEREMDIEKAENHYRCPKCRRPYTEEEALENDFKCPYCNVPLVYEDYEKIKEEREANLKNLEARLRDLMKLKKKLEKSS